MNFAPSRQAGDRVELLPGGVYLVGAGMTGTVDEVLEDLRCMVEFDDGQRLAISPKFLRGVVDPGDR